MAAAGHAAGSQVTASHATDAYSPSELAAGDHGLAPAGQGLPWLVAGGLLNKNICFLVFSNKLIVIIIFYIIFKLAKK